jgi:hypothetical protein
MLNLKQTAMKKILISVALISAVLSLYAQDDTEILKTKKGIPIKPEVGDFAVGIDATPFFRYAGNLFTGSNTYYPSFGFTAQAPGAIFGKYKVSATTTYRASVLFGISSNIDKSVNFTDPDKMDKTSTSALTLGLAAGIENHRDIFGRLSGYYGAQVGIRKTPYYDAANRYYGKLIYKDGNDSSNDYKETGGSTFGLSTGGFAGVEFYVAPRIALMGEFGYYLEFYTQGKRKSKPASGTETTIDYGNMGIDMNPVASGNLILLFYF